MEELIQIIVVVAFVLLSMIEGAARKKRSGAGAGAGAGTKGQAGSRPEYERPHGTTSADDEDFESSETLVPEALWEEIAQLARGEPQQGAPTETPQPTFGRPAKPIPQVGDRTPEPAPFEDAPRVLVPRSSPEPEPTPPPAPVVATRAQRAVSRRVVPDAEPTPSRRPEGRSHRFGLGGLSGQDALRRAIVLKEVLGPPVSLRGQGD